MIIAVDFDNTICKDAYPGIGSTLPLALETLKELQDNGHSILLHSCRTAAQQKDAVYFLRSHNIFPMICATFDNAKPYFDLLIDDRAVGTPLTSEGTVDWLQVRILLKHLL